MKISWKKWAIYLIVPLALGAISGYISGANQGYPDLSKPPLSPPGWVFPLVWSILYILMGTGAYLIASSDSPDKKQALKIYYIQLFLNFIWSPIFFRLENYFLAFLVLLLLWYCIINMILIFKQINPFAAILQIPYLIWVTFAGYLNLAILLLNR